MKRFSGLIILLIAVLVVLFPNRNFNINNYLYYSYCDRPVNYKIGTVDPRFLLTQDQFLADIKQAEKIWEDPYGKNLFDYKIDGELSINLIYDNRQSLNNQIDNLSNDLKKGQTNLKTQEAEFDKLKTDFETKLKAFNTEVEYYNERGGAPSEEFDKLKAEQEELQKEADQLNALAVKLNKQTAAYNTQVGQLNKTVDTLNAALENRPEEGIYIGPENKIEIYFNINKPELVHTLAHEMGHSLGLDHTQDPKSIMYPFTTQKIVATSSDLDSLTVECRKHSIFEGYYLHISHFIDQLVKKDK